MPPEPQDKKGATNDDDWIAVRVAEACQQQSLVSEGVSGKIKELLTSELSDGPIGATRLSEIANDLIVEMSPPKIEPPNED